VLLASGKTSAKTRNITIADRPVELGLAQVSPRTNRLSVVAIENGQPESIPNDGSIVQQGWTPQSIWLSTLSGEKRISFAGSTVTISPDPLRIIVYENDQLVQRLAIDQQTGTGSFDIAGGPVLGLGEGGPQFDRRGNKDEMRNGQGGYRLRTHGGRAAIPWLIGTGAWAMFIHQPFGRFDLTATRGRFEPINPAASLPINIFVVTAKEPTQVMAEYARLTGYPEMPPLWALGYLQSHRTLAGPDEIMSVARTFRAKKLPCDALIYLGTDFTPSGWNTHNGEFTWNPKNFPDPKQMIDELHAQHFKVVLHAVLEGRYLTGTVNDPCTASPLPSGRTPDGRWPDDRQVSCYWPVHKQLYDVGIDGWWPDQGDGFDGSSRLARHRMYYEGSRQLRPNERPFALHRNGRAGMQRYAAFLWSGDVYSTWLEPAYYYLGSDYRGSGGNSFTLSYMSQMGGWSVLDYALNYAPRADWYLRLGYASYLSAWALMNTGTPESNYGYWYPGKENDGGAGGGFEPAPYGQTWLNQPHHRGPWYYASEVDLGYSGALRTAATIIADDPVFGRFCFGGDWRKTAARLEVIPKDGVRRRFHAMFGEGEQQKLHMVLETDRFAASQPILIKEDFSEIRFRLESDNRTRHAARLLVSGLPAGKYAVLDGHKTIAEAEIKDGQQSVVDLALPAGGLSNIFTISRRIMANLSKRIVESF
jgi:hypothetical protein